MNVEQYNYKQVEYMKEWEVKIRTFARKMIIKRIFNDKV